MTPPRFPLAPDAAHAVAYAVGILRALHDANGNHERAAEAFGMSRRTMDDHIARLGMTELQSALWNRSVRQPKKRDLIIASNPGHPDCFLVPDQPSDAAAVTADERLLDANRVLP